MIPQETISLLLGYTSIGFWLGAQFPQIVVNWRRKSVDGLALPFLANWLLGDSTNLLGCILTDQLPFQTYLATYFVFVDTCLVIQYFYYDAPRVHVGVSAEGLISSASSIIIAPPHVPRPRTSSRTRASSSIPDNAVMSSISPTRRRAKSVDVMSMDMGVGDGLSTVVRSSSRGVTHPRITTDGVLVRSKGGSDGVGLNIDRIDEDNLEANNAEDFRDEEEDTDSHMITSFYSEGGGAHRPSRGKHVSWTQTRSATSGNQDGQETTPATTTRHRPRSRSIGFVNTTTNITEEAISSSPTDIDNRGRPTTPRSARMTGTKDGGADDSRYDYENEWAGTFSARQPFPSSSLSSQEQNVDLEPTVHSHYYSNRTRSRRASSTSTSAFTSRRSASVVFLGVLVLLGFSNFNLSNYSSTSMSVASTWQGNVLTPIPPEPNHRHHHDHQHYHYYHHPHHYAYQPNHYVNTHTPRNTAPAMKSSLHDENDIQKLIGRLAAWSCTTLYLTSRLPQIWKNYTRKSVEGLSMYLFAFAFCGNLFYVFSILSSPKMNLPGEQSREFLRESVPYLLGSGGTLLFDVTIVSQSFVYANSRRDRRKRLRARTLSSVMSGASTSSRPWRRRIRRKFGGESKRTTAVVNDEERGLLDDDGLMHESVGAGASVIGGGSESRRNTARLQAAEVPV